MRRSLLVSGFAAGITTRLGIGARAAASPEPLCVRLTLDGREYRFNEAEGRDLGDYAGPGFVQRCVMVTVPDLPLSVFMRPDRDSKRVELVFELGRMWNAEPRHLGPYSVEIARGATLLAHVNVPKHYWFSRWRWQSAQRPVVVKVADLIATGLLPLYATRHDDVPDHSATPATADNRDVVSHGTMPPRRLPPAASAGGSPYRRAGSDIEVTGGRPKDFGDHTIMDLAGVTAYMPTTGDRRDIGPVTEPQARYICTGDRDALEIVWAQAEASGTVPWNMRDEKTGAPFNFEQYPRGGWVAAAPQMCNPYIAQLKSIVTVDEAHHPSLTYLPFLLTGDPYYLEALQLSLTWLIGNHAPEYRQNAKCILFYWQTRAYAWCLRDVAQAAKVTPVNVPNWLLPQPYWRRILENNRVWVEKTFVLNTEPAFRVFRVATHINNTTQGPGIIGEFKVPRIAPWEEDYLAIIMGWTALMFPAWREAFVWKMGATIARTNGKSGWQRAYAAPFLFCLSSLGPDSWAQSWREAWDINAWLQGWHIGDPNVFAERLVGYLYYARAALALAARLDVAEAKECYAWADRTIRTSTPIADPYRWNIHT